MPPVEVLGQIEVAHPGVAVFFAQQLTTRFQHVLIKRFCLVVFGLRVEAIGQQVFAEQRLAVLGPENRLAPFPSRANNRGRGVILRLFDIQLDAGLMRLVGLDQFGPIVIAQTLQAFDVFHGLLRVRRRGRLPGRIVPNAGRRLPAGPPWPHPSWRPARVRSPAPPGASARSTSVRRVSAAWFPKSLRWVASAVQMRRHGLLVMALPVEISSQVVVAGGGVGMVRTQQPQSCLGDVLVERLGIGIFFGRIQAVGQQVFARERLAMFGAQNRESRLPNLPRFVGRGDVG